MNYINQHAYKHIPYRTRVGHDGKSPEAKKSSVSGSGCGLCSVCMMVELLTTESLSVEECVRIAEDCFANHSIGTDMKILAPVIAEKFGLVYTQSNDIAEAIAHLQCGGKIVVHVGVPESAPIGLFTKRGHYMLLIDTDGKNICLLDPSYSPDKFTIPERIGRVNTEHAPFLYCDAAVLHSETKEGKGYVKYHMFARKTTSSDIL